MTLHLCILQCKDDAYDHIPLSHLTQLLMIPNDSHFPSYPQNAFMARIFKPVSNYLIVLSHKFILIQNIPPLLPPTHTHTHAHTLFKSNLDFGEFRPVAL